MATDCFTSFAMTDHFFGGEGGEKEAGHQFSVIAESSPASFSLPSQNQQHTVIATTRNEVGSNLKGTKDIIKGK